MMHSFLMTENFDLIVWLLVYYILLTINYIYWNGFVITYLVKEKRYPIDND